MSMNRIVVLHTGSSASLVVFGHLDTAFAPEIARRLGLLIARCDDVHVDLGNIGSVDAVGLALLRDVITGAEAFGAHITLVCASDVVATAFEEPSVA
jgi:anti-anti-sigma factor